MRRLLIVLVALAAALLPGRAHAQLRQVPAVGLEGAKRALAAAEQEARAQGWNVSIAVVDPAGELVGFLRMDGAPQASVDIARGKARTAARFRRPTKALEEVVAGGRVAAVTFEGMVLIEGGVPIAVDEVVVGAVGVSGASSAQDAQVARAGAGAVTR